VFKTATLGFLCLRIALTDFWKLVEKFQNVTVI